MASFVPGEQTWLDRLGRLRNDVRQEVIARQIAPLAGPGSTVLDVGCGQGTQALRLAAAGCRVTAVDPSTELLAVCDEEARKRKLDLDLFQGEIAEIGTLCAGRTFDLVCCHGVMMYLEDWTDALGALAERVATGGCVSVTFRNGEALAMRPGLRGEWAAALASFDATEYVNELGLPARAHRVGEIEAALAAAGLRAEAWYGVRVFTDWMAADASAPDPETRGALLDAEERAGETAPYKWVASQLHVVARAIA